MMQHRIYLSDKYDPSRYDRAFARATQKLRISASMLSMAGKHQPDFEKKAVWHVLAVAEGHEQAVQNRLSEKNIFAWVPMRKAKKVRVRGRWKPAIVKPVLSGFVFVRVVPGPACWAGLMRIEGVFSLLGGGETPHRIRNEEMNQFSNKAKAGDYDYDSGFVLPDEITENSKALINDGPFAGFEGTVVDVLDEDVVVEVTLFGRLQPLRLPLAMVNRID